MNSTDASGMEPDKCAVCQNRSKLLCWNCAKVGYCSEVHRIENESKHMTVCYPVNIAYEPDFGRCTVASRNIRMGEDLLQEISFISSPMIRVLSEDQSICLACYDIVTSAYKCTTCSWPVCDMQCEMTTHHHQLECKIFAKEKILPEMLSFEYHSFLVMILRILILRKEFVSFREKINSLTSQELDFGITGRTKMPLKVAVDFIKNKCKMINSNDDIAFLTGVVGTNYIDNDDHSSGFLICRFASFLFHYASFISHDCITNTRWIIHNTQKGFCIKFTAVKDIEKGERITRSYLPCWPLMPTSRRQYLLQNRWCFTCTCDRCSDPTEIGTFLSAIRCFCLPGYIIPPKPLGDNVREDISLCTHCDHVFKYDELIQKVVNPLENQFEDLCAIKSTTNVALWSKAKNLEDFVKNSSRHLHSHHYLLINAQYEILQCLYLTLRDIPFVDGHVGTAQRMIVAADNCLRIADVLCPGISSYRGIILFYKQHAQCIILANNLKLLVDKNTDLREEDKESYLDYIKVEIEKVELNRILAKGILEKSHEGSFEKSMSEKLEPELNDLIDYKSALFPYQSENFSNREDTDTVSWENNDDFSNGFDVDSPIPSDMSCTPSEHTFSTMSMEVCSVSTSSMDDRNSQIEIENFSLPVDESLVQDKSLIQDKSLTQDESLVQYADSHRFKFPDSSTENCDSSSEEASLD